MNHQEFLNLKMLVTYISLNNLPQKHWPNKKCFKLDSCGLNAKNDFIQKIFYCKSNINPTLICTPFLIDFLSFIPRSQKIFNHHVFHGWAPKVYLSSENLLIKYRRSLTKSWVSGAEPGVVLLGLVPSPILGTVSTLLNTMLSRFSPPTLTGVTRIR